MKTACALIALLAGPGLVLGCALLPPNAGRVDGRKAVRDWTLQFTSATDWTVSWKPDQTEVAASGDLAYAVGHYELSLRDVKGNAVSDKGKFLDTLKKQPDGKRKLTVIAFNSDRPVAGAPVPK